MAGFEDSSASGDRVRFTERATRQPGRRPFCRCPCFRIHFCGLLFRFASLALVIWVNREAAGRPFVFGLDNRPRAPIGVDPAGFGNGAEDPFGLVPFPTLVGPSPSLGVTLSDGDILKPGPTLPVVDTLRPTSTNYVDAISSNRAIIDGKMLRLAFSVDRASSGASPSAVHSQFLLNQQPGDIFISERDFPAPNLYVGVSSGFGWFGNLTSVGPGSNNLLLLNQSQLKLTAGMGPGNLVGSTGTAPPISPSTHDNVDAFDIAPVDTSGDLIGDKHIYYSVNPDQRVLTPSVYASPADIYRTAPGSQTPTLFATANSMGLIGDFDDIDALDLFDRGTVGVLDPGVDYALFSLSPGSQSLHIYPGVNAADIFFTDFRGSFATFAGDDDLGLSGTVDPAELGSGGGGLGGAGQGASGSSTDNVDALSSYPLGDMDWSGSLDLDDVDDFVQGLTRPVDYRDVNIDHFGEPATILGDFSLPRDGLVDYDDVVPFRTTIQGAINPAAGQGLAPGVPEPCAATFLTIPLGAIFAGVRRSRRRDDCISDGRSTE